MVHARSIDSGDAPKAKRGDLRTRLWMAAGAGLFVASVAAACGSELGVAPPLTGGAGGDGAGVGSFVTVTGSVTTGPPPVDASGYCGNELHRIVSNAPNLLFVLDTSGSMATPTDGSTRYELVRNAAIGLVRQLGPLINVGVARFPSFATDEDPCHTGELVMPITPGDGLQVDGEDGPTTAAFVLASSAEPNGGTPLAATLRALVTPLSFVPGRTVLVLATDGGPNCNDALTCGPSQCGDNIEGTCTVTNCCDVNGPAGPSGCVDSNGSNDAVAAFASKGITTFVVGVPGSEAYEDVLSQLAVVGGSPQTAPPYYYKVDDLSALEGVFSSIASLEISCDFDLEDPPETTGYTNVYLDGVVLPENAIDGWAWTSSTTVELRGTACEQLKTGQVKQVQIVSGCMTVVH